MPIPLNGEGKKGKKRRGKGQEEKGKKGRLVEKRRRGGRRRKNVYSFLYWGGRKKPIQGRGGG